MNTWATSLFVLFALLLKCELHFSSPPPAAGSPQTPVHLSCKKKKRLHSTQWDFCGFTVCIAFAFSYLKILAGFTIGNLCDSQQCRSAPTKPGVISNGSHRKSAYQFPLCTIKCPLIQYNLPISGKPVCAYYYCTSWCVQWGFTVIYIYSICNLAHSIHI